MEQRQLFNSNNSVLSKFVLFCLIIKVAQGFTSIASHRLHLSTRAQLHARKQFYRKGVKLNFFTKVDDEVIYDEETKFDDVPTNTMPNVMGFMRSPNEVKESTTSINGNGNEGYMGDLVKLLGTGEGEETAVAVESEQKEEDNEEKSLGSIISIGGVALLALAAIGGSVSGDIMEMVPKIQSFFADPQSSLEAVVKSVEAMGTLGFLYFGAVYTAAEILAIPAIPLTASAGYLFGTRDGTIVVLISASIAAAVSFVIGRFFLRSYVEKALADYPDFQKIDKAIGEEGFKLMLLLRVSPIFPFALSNYLYGVTSIKFWPFFWGTMLGFAPGTVAYVFTGTVGKSLTLDSASAEPWYVYVGALALLTGFIKILSDTAQDIIEKAQED